jgi:hypothetical protein
MQWWPSTNHVSCDIQLNKQNNNLLLIKSATHIWTIDLFDTLNICLRRLFLNCVLRQNNEEMPEALWRLPQMASCFKSCTFMCHLHFHAWGNVLKFERLSNGGKRLGTEIKILGIPCMLTQTNFKQTYWSRISDGSVSVIFKRL